MLSFVLTYPMQVQLSALFPCYTTTLNPQSKVHCFVLTITHNTLKYHQHTLKASITLMLAVQPHRSVVAQLSKLANLKEQVAS